MKKILVITNHSYMLWRFRRELLQALLEENEVVVSTPFVGHEDDLAEMGCRMLETKVNRRGINPVTDIKLYRNYVKILKKEQPDISKQNIGYGLFIEQCGVRNETTWKHVE